MRERVLLLLVLLTIGCLSACHGAEAASTASGVESARITFPKIDRRPTSDVRVRVVTELPGYDPKSDSGLAIDLRRTDLSRLDLRASLRDLLHSAFDDTTVWPPADRMPQGFDRQRIMELGKNPGLGVRKLHAMGITGRGVGVAVIDQVLLTEHEQYADRLRLYEEINVRPDTNVQVHGPAVASLAVGKTIGVAPEADLYFIATWAGDWGEDGLTRNYVYLAQAIRRVMEINEQLPANRKIRVISISMHWRRGQKGYDEVTAACREAKASGLFVSICCGDEDLPDFDYYGLGRAAYTDPDAFELREPPLTRADAFYSGRWGTSELLIPMDSRTIASAWGTDHYVFDRKGGTSWVAPYLAGVYALAAQTDPKTTPERFRTLSMKTGRTIKLEHDGKKVPLGLIIDPVALVEELQDESSGEADAASTPPGDGEPERITFPKIDRHPTPGWRLRVLTSVPRYDPESSGAFGVDLRARDLSGLDLRNSLNDLLHATFDDNTVWPPDDRMPRGFDRQRIMELGKNPGLGVRKLHGYGITGRGVGIAIIDQVLLTKHEEYADRLWLYEEINVTPDTGPVMHGPAVASLAVGKTIGIAPEADLYFIATWVGDWGEDGLVRNWIYYAQAVRRIVAVNKQLRDNRKIRVISISANWRPQDKGYDEVTAACNEARAAGMLVICCGNEHLHGFDFYGLGRSPYSDPDAFGLREPPLSRADAFCSGEWSSGELLIPMDSRTTASPSGTDKYVFYRRGGTSWAAPYLAGLYALAVQVDPKITPERFRHLVMKTARKIELEHDGKKLRLGPIIDPFALVRAVHTASRNAARGAKPPPVDQRLTGFTFPKIDRHPVPGPWRVKALESLPRFDPEADSARPVELRHCDVSALDLRNSLNDLLHATFDTSTVWPPRERLPREFNVQRIAALGANPGLGIRTLHKRGITGRGVGIAIIDQPLLTTHREYADRLWFYEEINVGPNEEPQMHGPAVLSIAGGKTVGVAPEADLYYIGTWAGDRGPDGFTYNFTYKAQAIRRILEINKQLPRDRKIRVISISVGWSPDQKGYDEVMAANKEAMDAGLLVVSSSIENTHGFDFFMIGRAPLSNPDAFESYVPGLYWLENAERNYERADRLLIPTESRMIAGPGGDDEYVLYRRGGASWAIPYIAGVYALAAQVDPKITPKRFWSLAMRTGRTVRVKHNGKTLRLRPVIDPVAIIKALQRR